MNPNPDKKNVPDCVIRAICVALNQSWLETSDGIYDIARSEHSVTCDDEIWGQYLREMGFEQFSLPEVCMQCVTIQRFCDMYPRGIYIIGTVYHAVAVIDGNYYDSWDSGNEAPTFFWMIR